MPDLGKKIVEFAMEVVEHYQDQSFVRALTLREQQLFQTGREVLEDFALEGQLKAAGLFTGVLSKVPNDESKPS